MGDFFSFLGGILNNNAGVVASIANLFNWLLQVMVILFTTVWNALVAVFNFLYGIFAKVGKFFRHIWDGFIKRAFSGVFNGILKAHDWLEQKLGPILRILQRVRAFVDRILNRYVRPILNMIQRIRQFLVILKLFHVKWAERLDRRLVDIEVKMAAVFIEARRILNGVIDAVNLVVDPTRLLRHPILIISIRRSLPALSLAFTGQPLNYWVGERLTAEAAPASSSGKCTEQSFPLEIFKPSHFLGDTEDLPTLGFIFNDTEAAPDDVDALEPLGVFATTAKDLGGCHASREQIQAGIERSRQAILDAADRAILVLRGGLIGPAL